MKHSSETPHRIHSLFRLRKHPSERLQSEARVPPVAGRTQCEASRASEPQGQLPQPKDEATHRIHSLFRLRKHSRVFGALARLLITSLALSATGCGMAGRPPMAEKIAFVGMAEAEGESREGYDHFTDNPFLDVQTAPLSTFSIDVDTASYANVRRFLREGRLPPPDAVRIEELLNYFDYGYPDPKGPEPFSITAEVAEAPWNPAHRLVHLGLQGRRVPEAELPPSNLVFLLDVSGSMADANKLPLVQQAFGLLVERLRPQDRVAIVVYAGAVGLVLDSTDGTEKGKILEALGNLTAGGSTAGGAGIELAYEVAQAHMARGGNNRVILATDGDFNVGVSSDGDLVRLIEEKRKTGIFLTILGFGTGNYQDAKMEKLADAGNGNAAYIDSIHEARKVLVTELGGTLHTIAQDVKLQVEFNPTQVKAYRLIGYENRVLAARDFNDDQKDAGELGAGHSVTALYEIVPHGAPEAGGQVDPLKFQQVLPTPAAQGGELVSVKLRYKDPGAAESRLVTGGVRDAGLSLAQCSEGFRFASAVAELGLLLRSSPHKGAASVEAVVARAQDALGADPHGHRREFVALAEQVRALAR